MRCGVGSPVSWSGLSPFPRSQRPIVPQAPHHDVVQDARRVEAGAAAHAWRFFQSAITGKVASAGEWEELGEAAGQMARRATAHAGPSWLPLSRRSAGAGRRSAGAQQPAPGLPGCALRLSGRAADRWCTSWRERTLEPGAPAGIVNPADTVRSQIPGASFTSGQF